MEINLKSFSIDVGSILRPALFFVKTNFLRNYQLAISNYQLKKFGAKIKKTGIRLPKKFLTRKTRKERKTRKDIFRIILENFAYFVCFVFKK